MLNTYRAVLRGKLLEWLSDQPKNLPADQAVTVHITILDEAMLVNPAMGLYAQTGGT